MAGPLQLGKSSMLKLNKRHGQVPEHGAAASSAVATLYEEHQLCMQEHWLKHNACSAEAGSSY